MTFDTASQEYHRLIRLLGFLNHDPGNLTLLMDAMALAAEIGDIASGQRLIEHIATHALEQPQVLAQAVHLLLQAGQYAAAAEHGDKAIKGGIEHPAVIFNTAFAHFHSGTHDVAAALLSRLSPNEDCPVAALILHARSLHHLELTEDAEPLARRALEQTPDDVEARGLLALLLYENGDNTSALRMAHETLADDPDQLDALLACASVHFEQESIEASRKAWLHTVQAHPTCGRAWSGLAQLEFNELEFDRAEEHLKTAVQFMPDHIGTWHLLAWIYILRNDSTLAREALQKSYALDRNFGETHGGLAVVDAMDGLDEQARLGIRRALKLNPDGLSARYAEMLLLQKAGNASEASRLITQVLDRTAPDGSDSGRVLIARWLSKHQHNRPQTPPGQH